MLDCIGQRGIAFNVLVLLDASGSLLQTDAGGARISGLESLVANLSEMESLWAGSDADVDLGIALAVDTFASGYRQKVGWAGVRVAAG